MTTEPTDSPEVTRASARVRACPFAVFDEFGKPADDRVQNYAAAIAAVPAQALERIQGAAMDALSDAGYRRDDDCYVMTIEGDDREVIHQDTVGVIVLAALAALTAQPAAEPGYTKEWCERMARHEAPHGGHVDAGPAAAPSTPEGQP